MNWRHWLLILALGLVVLGALLYQGIGWVARALFDAQPKRRREVDRDETAPDEPDEPEPVIPFVGSRFIESTQVVRRTDDGSTITVLHLTPEGRRGLSVGDDE